MALTWEGTRCGLAEVRGEGLAHHQAGAVQLTLDRRQAQAQSLTNRWAGQPLHVGQHEHLPVLRREPLCGSLDEARQTTSHRLLDGVERRGTPRGRALDATEDGLPERGRLALT